MFRRTAPAWFLVLACVALSGCGCENEDRRAEITALHRTAIEQWARGERAASLATGKAALGAAEEAGDAELIADSALELGRTLRAMNRRPEAVPHFERAVSLRRGLDAPSRLAEDLSQLGRALTELGSFERALPPLEEALALCTSDTEEMQTVLVLQRLAKHWELRGQIERALGYQERARALSEKLGRSIDVAKTLGVMGILAVGLGRGEEAVEYATRSRETYEAAGDPGGAAGALVNLGWIQNKRSRYTDALRCYHEARKIFERLGRTHDVAITYNNVGPVHWARGDLVSAMKAYEKARELHALAPRGRLPLERILQNMAHVHGDLGEYAEALELYDHNIAAFRRRKDSKGLADNLLNKAAMLGALGRNAESLTVLQEAHDLLPAAGRTEQAAFILGGLGVAYHRVGDLKTAESFYRRALAIRIDLNDEQGQATTLANLAEIVRMRGDLEEAARLSEEALRLRESYGHIPGAVNALQNLGTVLASQGLFGPARARIERARRLAADHGLPVLEAGTVMRLAGLALHEGQPARALVKSQEARRQAARLGHVELEVDCLRLIGRAALALGRPAEAAEHLETAVENAGRLVGELADRQGALARGSNADIYALGLTAAAALKSTSRAAFFLESGRAGALLESLQAATDLRDTLPAALRESEKKARVRVHVATRDYQTRLAQGDEAAVGVAAKELDAARAAHRDTVERIQREAKAQADVLYPRADDLETIQTRLRPDEALVLYSLPEADEFVARALVVRRGAARLVELGPVQPLRAAAAALALDEEAVDPIRAVDAARGSLVAPLKLGADVRRVLISPDGPLAYVPFSVLLGDRDVAFVPSGTAYGVLLAGTRKRGARVLALGDPAYGNGGLAPLPGSGDEAKAVGDVLLVGEEASEAGLVAALSKDARWRAVHLACHGTVDPDRPLQSSIALVDGDGHDGFLTALEIYRMRIQADLVVLSACETAKGTVYRAEGMVGLTRAFMLAGTPRVLASLWRVDDEATRSLMAEFYRLWHPRDERPPLSAAEALRRAQAHVRAQPKWKHPRFWAAWVLWGLPQ